MRIGLIILGLLVQVNGIAGAVRASVSTDSVLYQSDHLVIKQLATGTLLHISHMQVEGFGKVQCNGVVVTNGGEALILDSPSSLEASEELVHYLVEEEHLDVKGLIATHFHDDCVAGLSVFQNAGIPGYASKLTFKLLKELRSSAPLPQHELPEVSTFKIGKEEVEVAYFGAGHTPDNMVAYYAKDQVLFGGCLIKELGAGEGNLSDADVDAWPETVEQVKAAYPETRIVVPGHGAVGDQRLLIYTMELFQGER